MDMREIWRLRHFLGVVDAMSLHGAARRMNVSQPALTKSIRQLEAAFGTELFLRLPRGVRLTEAGELLHKRAREIEASWNAAILEVGAQSSGPGGVMRLGSGPVYSAMYFPAMLADLRRRFPNLRIRVSTGVWTELMQQLQTGDIRAYAGGVPRPGELGSEFETEMLYHQENAVFAAPDHPLFREETVTARDALDYPWLCLFSGQEANLRISRYFLGHDLPEPQLALESRSLQIAFRMIAEHQFLACMPVPLSQVQPELGLREVTLEGFRWSIPTGVTYHRASLGFAPIAQMLRSLRRLTSGMEGAAD